MRFLPLLALLGTPVHALGLADGVKIYHSIDPVTGLREFSCGPSSDRHAGGWKRELQPDWQKFLRIKGGFLSVEADAAEAILRHHDVGGEVVNEVVIRP